MNKLNFSRRQALKAALFGPGYIGLKSLATGLPISVLLNGIPKTADAADVGSPQYLILLSNQVGDPINANAPGSYVDGVINNPAETMAPTSLSLGGYQTTAAAPWATLPQWALDQTTFIHHRTYQNTHGAHNKVLALLGNAVGENGSGTETIPSVYSSETRELLGTIQTEPIALAGNTLSFQGRALQTVQPKTLGQLFATRTGIPLELAKRRKTGLDEINAALKADGTPAQRKWLDRYASTQEQIEEIDESLLETFSTINNNGQDSQIAAAIALIQMKVSPVIQIVVGFGGDNHADANLAEEAVESVIGIQAISSMMSQLEAVGKQDEVTVANLSVFGRTLKQKGTNGRNHNLNHHVMMVSGSNVNPGVIGSLAESGNDFGATGIDSVTGAGNDNADIPQDETLEAATKTLGCALGIPAERINSRIIGGKVIEAALKS